MEDKYYVIQNSDGDTTVTEYTKEKLLKELEEEGCFHEGIFPEFPRNERDTNYWSGTALIIKGSVVKPEPEEIVTKYKID